MNKATRNLGLGIALGLAGMGCGTNASDSVRDPAVPPPLSVEEQAAADNMIKGTLAEIDLPEGKMRIIEVAPGEVLINREFAIGAKLTRVANENSLTLEQLFHAYAPNRATPPALSDAAVRVAATKLQATGESKALSAAASTFAGHAATTELAPSATGAERTTSALSSTIDAGWFTQHFCNVSNSDGVVCFATAWTGAWAFKHSHRTGSVTCGDTGAARANFTQNGGVLATRDIAYGTCQTISGYHGPHGIFGVNLERDLRHNVTWAESTVRFAAWFADEDQFIGGGY